MRVEIERRFDELLAKNADGKIGDFIGAKCDEPYWVWARECSLSRDLFGSISFVTVKESLFNSPI